MLIVAIKIKMMKHIAWLVLGAAACRGASSAGTIDALRAPTDSLYLTVKDIGGHCSVTIDGEDPFTSAQESLADFDPGQTISLTASATTGFTLGLWHHTVNDTGSGDPGTITDTLSSTSVTLGDAPGCVWICCSSGSNDCPTTDQCL